MEQQVHMADQKPSKASGILEKRFLLIAIAGLATLLIALVLNHFGMLKTPWAPEIAPVGQISQRIKRGSPTMTKEEIIDVLENGPNIGKLSIIINARPVFEDGYAEGNLFIVNPIRNPSHMEYKIFLEETGELIYQTPIMEPNTYIDNDKLSIALPEGKHEALAEIYAYRPDDFETPHSMHTAGLIITVNN
jgi:hypothetical protein